jgi:hypothetical protein
VVCACVRACGCVVRAGIEAQHTPCVQLRCVLRMPAAVHARARLLCPTRPPGTASCPAARCSGSNSAAGTTPWRPWVSPWTPAAACQAPGVAGGGPGPAAAARVSATGRQIARLARAQRVLLVSLPPTYNAAHPGQRGELVGSRARGRRLVVHRGSQRAQQHAASGCRFAACADTASRLLTGCRKARFVGELRCHCCYYPACDDVVLTSV